MATLTGSTKTYYGIPAYGQLDYYVSALDSGSNTVTISGIVPHFRFSGGTTPYNLYSIKRNYLRMYVNGTQVNSWGSYTYSIDGNAHNYTSSFGNVYVPNPNQSGAGFSFTLRIECSITFNYTGESAKSYSATSSAETTISVAGVSRASVLNITSNSVEIGGSQGISITSYLSGATHTLTYSFLTDSGSLTASNQTWTIPASFETLMPSITSASCSLTLTTYNSGGGYVGASTKTFMVTIPATYLPTITLGTLTKTNAYQGQLIAGTSSFSQAYTLALTPTNNSATIDSVSASITNNVDVASCTTTATTSDVLPASASDYSVSLTIVVTDTRGRTATEIVNVGTAKAFTPPVVGVNQVYRCLSDGTEDPAGTYAFVKATATSNYTITSVKCSANGTDYPLTLSGGYYQAIVGGGTLATTSQYTLTISVKDEFIDDFGLSAVSVSVTLSTMALPLSLYDDGNDNGVTIGKVADGPDFHVYMDTILHGTLSGTHVGDQVTFELNGTTLNIVDVS